jgi:plastocyanin
MRRLVLNQSGLSTIATIGIVAGLIVLAALGWMWLADSGQPVNEPTAVDDTQSIPTDEVDEEEEPVSGEEAAGSAIHTVTYTNDGFTPASLTIKQGDTVEFVNRSDRDFHPASNDHPDHTIYPEFDARDEIEPGGSYSFTFERAGSWGYHNHELEGHTGTIVVQ